MMMRAILVACLLCLSLAGCATYQLTLQPQGPGPMAHGVAKQSSKTATVVIDGRTFTGHFTYVQGGTFTLASVTNGFHESTGTAAGINMVGNGNFLAHSPDGENLDCVFTFSGLSGSGYGVCQLNGKQIYHLQITREY
jgi:hypothetical protein